MQGILNRNELDVVFALSPGGFMRYSWRVIKNQPDSQWHAYVRDTQLDMEYFGRSYIREGENGNIESIALQMESTRSTADPNLTYQTTKQYLTIDGVTIEIDTA